MYDHILTICAKWINTKKEMLIIGTLKKFGLIKTCVALARGKRRGTGILSWAIRYAVMRSKRFLKTALENFISHINTTDKVPREHGNKGRRPSNVFSFKEIKNAITFLETCAALGTRGLSRECVLRILMRVVKGD